MSPLEALREKLFPGYKTKDVSVDWLSGRQTVKKEVLTAELLGKLLGSEAKEKNGSVSASTPRARR
jgi:hypothetical protein